MMASRFLPVYVFLAGLCLTSNYLYAQTDDIPRRYIIWGNPNIDFNETVSQLEDFQPFKDYQIKIVAAQKMQQEQTPTSYVRQSVYEKLEGIRAIVVDLPPSLAEQINQARAETLKNVSSVAEDFVVSTFDDDSLCQDEANALPASPVLPPGICRVGGGGMDDFSIAKVWVLDTGVDNVSGFLNVDMSLARNCISACVNATANNIRDRNGHGTMVAGIIGARPSAKGVYGVAPWAKIIPVRIFKRRGKANFSEGPIYGLDYLVSTYAGGSTVTDVVVNISWGGSLLMDLRRNTPGENARNVIDRQISLADKGIKVVVAAGNADPELPTNWVEFVFPALAGGYTAASGGGAIYTVSAVTSEQLMTSPFTWTDTWWEQSNAGKNPPNFAEPGVNIQSLWLKDSGANQLMICSGTSFAAPHLSGILARQIKSSASYPLAMSQTANDDPIDPDDPVGESKAPKTDAYCPPP
jgi:subtilisin family serine protease